MAVVPAASARGDGVDTHLDLRTEDTRPADCTETPSPPPPPSRSELRELRELRRILAQDQGPSSHVSRL